jgi:hypothetical protein
MSLHLSAALLRAILMNHLAHSEATRSSKIVENQMKTKIDAQEAKIKECVRFLPSLSSIDIPSLDWRPRTAKNPQNIKVFGWSLTSCEHRPVCLRIVDQRPRHLPRQHHPLRTAPHPPRPPLYHDSPLCTRDQPRCLHDLLRLLRPLFLLRHDHILPLPQARPHPPLTI